MSKGKSTYVVLVVDSFHFLGAFSSKEKAKKAMKEYIEKVGHDDDEFEVLQFKIDSMQEPIRYQPIEARSFNITFPERSRPVF